MTKTFTLDGKVIPFEEGETIMEAAAAAGVYIRTCATTPSSSRTARASCAR